jgi:hypothetical protein
MSIKVVTSLVMPIAMVASVAMASPAHAQFDPSTNVQGTELLTIQNNANAKLANTNLELRIFKNEGFVFYNDALNHFNDLERGNKRLVGVYFHKQYSGTETINKYQLVADKDALTSDQAKTFDTILKVESKNSHTAEQQATQFTGRFVPIMDGDLRTIDPDVSYMLLCFFGFVVVGSLIIIAYNKSIKE